MQRLHENDEVILICNAMSDENNLSKEDIEKEMATGKENEFKFER